MSDFGKEVGQVYRGIKKTVEEMPVVGGPPGASTGAGATAQPIDRSVREQVISDIDRLIERHEKG